MWQHNDNVYLCKLYFHMPALEHEHTHTHTHTHSNKNISISNQVQ